MPEKAVSIYLKHPTIKGGASDPFKDHLNVESVSYSVDRRTTPIESSKWEDSSASGGEITLVRRADMASADCLLEACKKPKAADGAQHDMSIHFVQAGNEEYLKIRLENCQITGYDFSASNDKVQPTETLTITFHALKQQYSTQPERGWNFADNSEP